MLFMFFFSIFILFFVNKKNFIFFKYFFFMVFMYFFFQKSSMFFLSNMYKIHFVFSLDFFSYFFSMLLIFVSVLILWYSDWYFISESSKNYFMMYMSFFICFMFMLVFSNSILFILMSWESVSIMSFLLICWWSGRSEATQSSVQAMLYNRVSDFGFFFVFCFLFMSKKMYIINNNDMSFSFFLNFFLIMCILAKSSQFMFHPWLPNAMESPTPVSSLLHSSTMVVASVFLYIRCFDYMSVYSVYMLSFFGGLTMVYSSLCSVGQNDVKKIIAMSTTSQLSFMMVSCSFLSPMISFFLLSMHAFFKSLLFMTSSMFIHSSENDQNMNNLSGIHNSNISNLAFILAAMSLMSMPFFSSFYSKDLIIENLWGNFMNSFFCLIFSLSSMLTVAYSLRLIFYSSFKKNKFSKKMNLEMMSMNLSWLFFLSIGAMILSFFFFFFFFLQESYLSSLKLIPLLILFTSIFFFYFIFFFNFFISYYMFFFNPLIHRLYNNTMLFFSGMSLNYEFFWMEKMIKKITNLQKKTIYMVSLNKIFLFFAMLIFFLMLMYKSSIFNASYF